MLSYFLNTTTFRQSQITIAGTIVSGTLGALFYIVMARILGPSDFGLLTVSIATLTVISDIADFGTNTGVVRFVSANIIKNKEEALKFLKLSLEIKLFVWILVLLAGFLLSPFLANNIFGKVELLTPLRMVMFGVGGALLFSFATSSLQSFQKYFSWAFINVVTNALRLVFILLLIFYQQLSLVSGLLTFIILPFFGFSFALMLLPTKAILNVKGEFSVARTLFSYNIWVALFTIIAALSSRLDTFLNARLLSAYEVGIYGAATQLVQVIPQIVGALGVVAAPKLASFQSIPQMIVYFKKFQLMVLGLASLGLLVIPISFYVIPLIYGSDYQQTIFPFIILLLAMLVFLISVPLHNSIIFYYGKPQVFVWVSLGHLLIIAILGYILILNFGIVGAATVVLVGMLFNFFAPLIWFIVRIKQNKMKIDSKKEDRDEHFDNVIPSTKGGR